MIKTGCLLRQDFDFPFLENEVEALSITYKQNNLILVEKTKADCSFYDGYIITTLTQEESAKFENKAVIKIQIRVRLSNGTATKSNVVYAFADELLKKGAI